MSVITRVQYNNVLFPVFITVIEYVMAVAAIQVSQWYDLVVFTASMEIYGAAVAEKLDRNRGILKRRYYRQVGGSLTDSI